MYRDSLVYFIIFTSTCHTPCYGALHMFQISTSAQNVAQAGSEEETAIGNATDVMDTEDTHVNEQVV